MTKQISKRRWYQYSLRTLFVFMVLFAIACSWFAVKMQRVRKREEAVRAIVEAGGDVVYDYQVNRSPGSPPKRPGPAWMRKLFGDDFFAKVILAGVKNGEDLEPLKELPNLESLEIIGWEKPITAAGLEHLKKLTKLRMLNLPVGSLTNDDLEELQQALPSCVIMHSYPRDEM